MPRNPVAGGGTQDPYPTVDPNGLQAGATASTAIGLGLVVIDSGGGDAAASAFGLGSSPEILSAGLAFQNMGHMNLFSAGVILIALGIVANLMSLMIRWQIKRASAEDTSESEKPAGGTKP
jgi:hypothetical protein